jgi:hypothetical protein
MPEISEAQASKYVTHNSALRVLDALVQATVIDKDLTVPPGSPSDGDAYIVGTTDSSSGDWQGHDDDVAYYQSSGWVFATPIEGWLAYVQDEGVYYTFWGASIGWAQEAIDFTDLDDTPSSYASGDGGKLVSVKNTEDGLEFVAKPDTLLELTDAPSSYSGQANKTVRVNNGETAVEFDDVAYEARGFFNGTPSAAEVLIRLVFTQSVNFPDDLSGSQGACVTGPSDSAGVDLAIKRNGTQFATMSFASAATTATFSTSSADETFSAGDVLTVEAPNPQDGAFADGTFTFKGTLLS